MGSAILRNLRIKRVSLVDMGANFDKGTKDGAHIELFKSAPSVDSVHVPVPPLPRKDEPKTDKPVNDKEKPVNKSIIARLFGLATETDVTKRTEAAAEIAKEFGGEDQPVHKADDPMCKCADCMNKRTAKSAADVEDVNKRYTDLEKRNADLEKRLNDEIEKREMGETTSILKSFRATPIDLDKDVAVFHKMHKSDPATFDAIITKMRAADEMLAQSALFKQVGSGRSGSEGGAWAQLEAKADAMLEKSSGSMTHEQALEKVMMDPKNRELVKQYRAEQQ